MSRYSELKTQAEGKTKAKQGEARINPLFLLICFAMIVGGGIGAAGLAPAPQLGADMCRTDQPLAASTVVLVDATDPFTEAQHRQATQDLKKIVEDVPRSGKLTLLFLQGDRAYDLQERVSQCNPMPSASNPVNILLHSVRRERAKWLATFGKEVEGAVDKLDEAPRGETSPIAEALQVLPLRTDFHGQVANRRLILVSDLMQRSAGGSFYTLNSAGAAQAVLTAAGRPDLTGVRVDLMLLQRPEQTARQTAIAIPAWCGWLKARGASAVTVNGGACPAPRETV
ncbi:hypothetical protein [Caulobacter endophyticus]|uniref:hypothetical protein n=1 Tax=Caulobacter endophyticus TaxID=2172652 RepID=UPI00240F7AE3|nr:hypothetical protein [Caulobacter endophyticus]MDG2528912.1 hypothetical protein [Caulobacter endophyticus]